MLGWIVGALFSSWGIISNMIMYSRYIGNRSIEDTIPNGLTYIMLLVNGVVYIVFFSICVAQIIFSPVWG